GLPSVVLLAGVFRRIVGELPADPARGTLNHAPDRLPHSLGNSEHPLPGGRLRIRGVAGVVPAERCPGGAVDAVVHRIQDALDHGGDGTDVDAAAAGGLALSLGRGGRELLEAGLPRVVLLAGVFRRIVGELPADPAGGTLTDAPDRLPGSLV